MFHRRLQVGCRICVRRGRLLNILSLMVIAMPSSFAFATPPPPASADESPAELSSDAAYDYAMRYLTAGRQQDAESLLQQARFSP